MKRTKIVRWRHWFRVVHRDMGYTCVALILAYSLSGLAVNHIEDWNPNYQMTTEPIAIGPVVGDTLAAKEEAVVLALGLDRGLVRGHFAESSTVFRVFLAEGQEVNVDTATGLGTHKTLRRRPVWFEINALHLNTLKGAWTIVADIFAIALILLALTGMTMMKGNRGLAGRGKYFVVAGLLVPVGFVVYLYSG